MSGSWALGAAAAAVLIIVIVAHRRRRASSEGLYSRSSARMAARRGAAPQRRGTSPLGGLAQLFSLNAPAIPIAGRLSYVKPDMPAPGAPPSISYTKRDGVGYGTANYSCPAWSATEGVCSVEKASAATVCAADPRCAGYVLVNNDGPVEGTPYKYSDLALLFGEADTDPAKGGSGAVIMPDYTSYTKPGVGGPVYSKTSAYYGSPGDFTCVGPDNKSVDPAWCIVDRRQAEQICNSRPDCGGYTVDPAVMPTAARPRRERLIR